MGDVPPSVFQPIGPAVPDPPVIPDLPLPRRLIRGLSHAERWRREHRTKAQQSSGTSPQTGSGKAKRAGRHLSHDEAQRLVADIARVNHAIATGPQSSASERKNASVAVGVSVDKFLALSAHASRPVGAEPDDLGLLALGERLAETTQNPAETQAIHDTQPSG